MHIEIKKTIRYFVALIILFLITPSYAQAQKKESGFELYCLESYDEYRQIKYWARRYISVSDYKYNSGDSNYLNLTYKDNKDKFDDNTNKQIVNHFNKEFDKTIKGKLPFHDVYEGRDKRFNDLIKKYGNQDNFNDIMDAQEEARRNSLYGPNPGAIYCNIRISRREFPVLYEMECSIVANKDLWNRNGLVEKRLGYSTPDHIVGEIKHSITEQLENLNNKLKTIRNCSK